MDNTFTDNAGRSWPIKLDIFTVRRLKQETGVDLIDSADPLDVLMQKITGNVVLFADVLISLLQDAMRDREVSDEQLLRSIDNEEVVENAALALVEAILSFSRKPKAALLKTAFGKTMEATRKQEELRIQQAEQKINSAEFETVVAAAVETAMAGSGSSNSPPPPESSPGDTA